MVVITIIVLVLALAVPVVRSIEGNRSLDAAYNKLSAALGHARQLALYYHAPSGIAIYPDKSTGLYDIGFVTQEKNIPTDLQALQLGSLTAYEDDRYMDLIPGEEIYTMPPGVGIQVVTNPALMAAASGLVPVTLASGTFGQGDTYLRIGIILFDENGQLASSTPYFVRGFNGGLGSTWGLKPLVVGYYGLIPPYQPGKTALTLDTTTYPPPTTYGAALYSHSAVVVYDDDTYKSQTDPNNNSITFGEHDRTTNLADSISYASYFQGSGPVNVSTKTAEQTWLAQNGQILVIKPNDGSLLRNQ
jgi:type II secretory pathway pseudopilin PulG